MDTFVLSSLPITDGIENFLTVLESRSISKPEIVAYVSVAMDEPLIPRFIANRWKEKTIESIEKTGASVVEIDSTCGISSTFSLLLNADCICVEGGNTFLLAKWAREIGLKEILEKLTVRTWIGYSAGAILAGESISLAEVRDSVFSLVDIRRGYAGQKGLGLVPFSVWPHCNACSRLAARLQRIHVPEHLVDLRDNEFVVTANDKTLLYNV